MTGGGGATERRIPDRGAFTVRDVRRLKSGGGDEVVGDEQGGSAGGEVSDVGGGGLPFG